VSWEAAARAGDWARAWAIGDAVLAGGGRGPRDDPGLPYHLRWVWDGRALDGCDVLVRCYHGLGDVLHFARYLSPLARRAARVTVEAPPALTGLLGTIGGIEVVPFDPARPLPPAERDVEIMELAHALRIAPEELPPPYLAVGEVVRRPGSVGVCWRGGDWDPARSVPEAALEPLFAAVEPRRLWSLVPGEGGVRFANGGGCTGDVGETALLLASLERIVTIDSMVAHLAGALGLPAIVLLRAEADWRWGEGERCALYPAHTLRRQARAGEWDAPVRAAVRLLG
jgi:hypothetical protein